MGIKPATFEIGLGPDYKVSGGLRHSIESGKIRVAAIHDIESTCFQRYDVQNVDLVEFSVGDVYEAWDIAPQIQ